MQKPILFLFLSLLWGCGGTKTEQASESPVAIQNPVIRGEFPDPSVIEVDGTYYACGTSNDWAPVYPIYSSTDLTNWTFESYVFMEAPEWTMGSFWAPELFYRDGKFFCYYTARRKDGISCIGVASTADISKGFTDHGELIEWGSESIDAYVFDQKGQLYITWKAYGLNPDKPIQLLGSKLSSDGLALEGEAFPVVTAEANTWERGGIEGQSIVQQGEYLYLLYSGAACCGGGCDYKVGVARAKRMEGPWEKYGGNPILTDFGNWKCPGHGTPVSTGDDSWYYLYHAYAREGFPYMGRSALLSPFYWDEKTGWPYFKTVDLMADSDGGVDPISIEDAFDGDQLKGWWRWDLASNDPVAQVGNGQLQLSGARLQDAWATALCVVPEKPAYQVVAEIPTDADHLKGLMLYGTHANMLGAGVKNGKLAVFQIRDGKYTALGEGVTVKREQVTLKAQVENGHEVRFAYQKEDGEWQQLSVDATENGLLKGEFLEFWQWGVKPGLFVEGEGKGSFSRFELVYDW
ncbi:beta-xylosidase [Echinicola strongylocentroti]|uniref:Beta-xylosidase n=1 Tax=Echinicola strongylocentroti TaxID=1795355 RepID=A0A2Z4IJ27_9BACT|nr:glycoside hydrolase family 43 protein [Echinicola strongylocentroti]AWW30905.1 beta-xylosidase [Echinicola strongylocentroti]